MVMVFLVVAFQTLKHVNTLLSLRTIPAQEEKQEFDQEVLTPVPPLSSVIGERYMSVDLLPRRGKTWS